MKVTVEMDLDMLHDLRNFIAVERGVTERAVVKLEEKLALEKVPQEAWHRTYHKRLERLTRLNEALK